jgi:hypothetical protein
MILKLRKLANTIVLIQGHFINSNIYKQSLEQIMSMIKVFTIATRMQ